MLGIRLPLILGTVLSLVAAAAVPPVADSAGFDNSTHAFSLEHVLKGCAPDRWYMALGSSFAAGPGIPPVEHAQAERSQFNYAHYFASAINARYPGILDLVDRTVARSKLLHLYKEPQPAMNGMTAPFPIRVEFVAADSRLVTITSGGNDINYIGGLGSNVNSDGPEVDNGIVQRYREAIDAIKRKAPRAKIVLLEYPTVLGDASYALANTPDVPLPRDRIDYYRRVGDRLQDITRRAAENNPNVYRIDVAFQSRAHAVGSNEPWVNGARGPRPGNNPGGIEDAVAWHPNRRGMQAVGDMLVRWVEAHKAEFGW